YCLGQLGLFRAEILFVDGAGLSDHESHHTRGAVIDRVSDKGESSGHHAIDDIVLGSVRSMWSLARQYPKHIAVERNMLAHLVFRKILARVSDERIDRTIELVAGAVPVQT